MSVWFYSADLSYVKDGFEKSFKINFISNSNKKAVFDALRFYAGRKEAFKGIDDLPDLACIKVYVETVNEIDAQGNFSRGLRQIFEWKHDWGTTVEQHIGAMR